MEFYVTVMWFHCKSLSIIWLWCWHQSGQWRVTLFGKSISMCCLLPVLKLSKSNLQAKVSATVRLFGGDSSHTPFFDWRSFQRNALYPLVIIHMEHINVLDFGDKSDRNWCFSFGNLGIIFNGASAQLFPPWENGLFGWVRGHTPANGGRD